MSPASDFSYTGSILPLLDDGWTWTLRDLGDTVAAVYELHDRAFTVTFPFPPALRGSPSDYVVVVRGFSNETRTPTINNTIDILGYARIRLG